MSLRTHIGVYAFITGIVVVLDQVSKAWARTALAAGPIKLVPGAFELMLVKNTGAAFSIGSGSTWIFVLLALGICTACTVWVVREHALPWGLVVALGFVAGGGIGNLIDRIVAGEVTDFIATTAIDFPVCNIADISITCGVIAVLVLWWRWDSTREQTGGAASTV